MRPYADHIAQAVTLLLAASTAFAAGRVLWRRSRVLALVAGTATFFAAVVPLAILVLILSFQVFGIDLVD